MKFAIFICALVILVYGTATFALSYIHHIALVKAGRSSKYNTKPLVGFCVALSVHISTFIYIGF